MVAICEEYATECNVRVNGMKSKLLIFKGRIDIKAIEVNDDIIHSSEMADHPGHTTSVSDTDSLISAAIASFWRKPLTYLCMILVIHIHFSSASCLNINVVVLWFK